MQHQQELAADEGVDGPQRMPLVALVPFDVEAVVVAEVHGEDVVRHVGHAVPDDEVGGQPVPEEGGKKKKNDNTALFILTRIFSDKVSRPKYAISLRS